MHLQTAPVIPGQPTQSKPTQRFLPSPRIEAIKSYREAVRLAFEHRSRPGMTQRTLAEEADLYAPHVSSYLHESEFDEKGRPRLELPAKKIKEFQRAVGNDIVAQYLASQWSLNLMEQYLAWRQVAA